MARPKRTIHAELVLPTTTITQSGKLLITEPWVGATLVLLRYLGDQANQGDVCHRAQPKKGLSCYENQ